MIGYIVSALVGYWSYAWSSAEETGGPNKLDQFISEKIGQEVNTSLKHTFSVDEKHELVVHVHHWLYLLTISMLLPSDYFSYFAVGGIIHGVGNYDDWWNIIEFRMKDNQPDKKTE
jgi:hypothetical protein